MPTHPMAIRGMRAGAAAAAIALTSLLSLPSAAAGATVTTPALIVPTGHIFWCMLTNLGSRPLENIAIERVNVAGNATSGSSAASLAPGAILAGGGTFSGTVGYCRVSGVSSRKVNLTACVQATTTSPCASLTTSD